VVYFFFAGGTYEAMEAVEDVEPVISSAFPS